MKLRGKLNEVKVQFEKMLVSLDVGVNTDIEKYQDKDLDIEIKVHRNHRSLDANACLWACIHDLAGALGIDNWSMYLLELKAYGKFTTIYVLPEAFTDLAKQWRETEIVGETYLPAADGTETAMFIVNCYYGSHTYDSKEFARLLNGVIEDMKAQGLDTPPSSDMKRMLEELEKKDAKVHDTSGSEN